MANGRSLIFESLTVTDAGNNTNTITVNLTDDENITISNELEEALVEGGQTIQQLFNQSVEVMAYDLGIIDGTTNVSAYVQTNSQSIPSNKANMTLNGASGSVDVSMGTVRVVASRPFGDLRRDHVMVKATLTSTSGITVTDV